MFLEWWAPVTVAKGIRAYNDPEFFAAAPVIESQTLLLCRASRDHTQSIRHVDVTRAHFYVGAARRANVSLPDEGQETQDYDMCGKLAEAMYVTCPAAQNWQPRQYRS